MADIVGSVAVKVLPDSTGFNAALQAQLNQIGQQAAGSGQAISRALGGANDALTAMGGGLKSVALGVAGVTAAFKAAEFAAKKFAGILGGIFDVSTKARIGFTALLGDSAKAEKLLTQVTQLATSSPFDTEPLIQASQRLLGVGKAAETIVPTLTHVGDLISAMGGDPTNIESVLYALTQIQTVGRLTGQDAMQLKNSLIPITKLLAESLGKTQADIQKMQEAGQISADMVFTALDKAGIKVAGAMNNAVNTVSGGLSVLRDTLQGLYRQSPFLQKLYVDVVAGIKSAAAFVGGAEFTDAFNRAAASAEAVYVALKPVLSAFAEIGHTTIIQTLTLTATALGVIASALSAIPEPVLKLLITGLLLNRSIKGVAAIQQLAASIGGLAKNVTGMGKATEMAGEQAAVSATKWQKFAKAASQAAAAALLVAGSVVSDGNNGTRDVVGGALSMAGVGAAIGSSFGPEGAAVGAAAGAAIGLLTSLNDQSEKQAKAHRDAMIKIGTETGAGYIKGISTELAAGEAAGFTALQRLIDEAQLALVRAKSGFNDIKFVDPYAHANSMPGPGNAANAKARAAQVPFTDEILKQEAILKSLNDQQETTYGNAEDKLKKMIPLLDKNSDAYKMLTRQTEEHGPATIVSLDAASEGLAKYGITIDDLAKMAEGDLATITKQFDGLTTAQQDAALAATGLAKAWVDAKAAADGLYAVPISNLNLLIAAEEKMAAARSAIQSAAANPTDLIAQQKADLAVLQAAEAAYQKALVGGGSDSPTGRVSAQAAAEAAYAAVFVQAQKDKTEATRQFTTHEHAAAAERLKIYQDEQLAQANVAAQTMATAAIQQASTESHVRELERLAQVADTVANRKIVVDIVVNGIEEALRKIALLQATIASTVIGAKSKYQSTGETADQRSAAQEQVRKQNHIIDILSGKVPDDLGLLPKVSGDISAAVSAAAPKGAAVKSGKSAEDLAKAFADKVASASDSLASALDEARKSAQSFADSLKADIRERTQYTAAISATRLSKNATRQAADLTEIDAGISTLLGRGLSQAAITAAIGTVDVTDLKQVRKLLADSPGALASFSSAMLNLDQTANRIATERTRQDQVKTITEAIVAAAALLGYKVTPEQAAAISAEFTINSTIDSKLVADDILSALSGAKITR